MKTNIWLVKRNGKQNARNVETETPLLQPPLLITTASEEERGMRNETQKA